MLKESLSIILIFIIIFFFQKKQKIYLNKSHQNHKKLINLDGRPIIGGIFLIIVIIFFTSFSLSFKIASSAIFLLGVFSDINILSSPFKRLFLQTLFITIYLLNSKELIIDLRSEYLNDILSENIYISLLFTSFCILILINGTNFIDGLNGLVTIYYLFVLFAIIYLSQNLSLNINSSSIKLLFLSLLIFLFLNSFSKALLGDSGAYLIGFFIGIILINFQKDNPSISPYFIAVLLWYPAYENLFSILRKKLMKINPSKPDNLHLHQLIYLKLKLYFSSANILSSTLINSYNLFIFILSVNFYNDTVKLLFIILVNIALYTLTYVLIYKKS